MYTVYIKSCYKKNISKVENLLNIFTNYEKEECIRLANSIYKKEIVIIQFGNFYKKEEFINSLKKLKCKIYEK